MADLGRKEYYYNGSLTVAVGASDQAVDILGALVSAGRDRIKAAASYLKVVTDIAITMKINNTSATAVTVDTTDGVEIPAGVMSISKVYFTHTGASSASGNATVEIFAA